MYLPHCVCLSPTSEGTLYLHVMGAGANLDGTSGYEEYKNVNQIFIHENYDSVTHMNDLAILRVSRKGGLSIVLFSTEMAVKSSVFSLCRSFVSQASLSIHIFIGFACR